MTIAQQTRDPLDNIPKRPGCSLSIFIPCFNEQGTVEQLTLTALVVGRTITADLEVILINDGSTDKTADIADALTLAIPEVKVVHHRENRGYGAALQSGIQSSTKELVFYTDGDAQFDIKELPRLIPLLSDCDIVSGYRLSRKDGFMRKVSAWCWGVLVCAVFTMQVRDINCAFKLYRRKVFDSFELKSSGAMIDTEILVRAMRSGYTIKQTGVLHYPRICGRSTGASPLVMLRAFAELIQLAREMLP